MAIFDLELHYFCNGTTCRAAFLGPHANEPTPRPSRPSHAGVRATPTPSSRLRATEGAGPVRDALPPHVPEDVLPAPLKLEDDRAFVEPIGKTILTDSPNIPDLEPRDAGALLVVIAVIAGTLAVLLGLSSGGRLVLVARVMLAGVGVAMLVARSLTTPRDASDAHPLPLLAGPVASVGVAAWAALDASTALAGEAAALAGAITTAAALSFWLLEISRRSVVSERAWVHASLDVPGRRLVVGDDGPREEPSLDIRPGELVTVAPGEDVPVDLTITEGDVEVLPWLGATTPVRRGKGDAVVAGARLLQGRLVGTCTWTGNDRTFARLVLDPRRRADALAPAAHAPRSLAERWAAITATGAAILTYAISRSPLDAAMTLVAVQAGLSTPTIASLASVHVARGVLLAQRRGIGYRSADAWDRAARATIALFCARGTLLLGEPEVAEVEPLAQNIDALELLGLAAGAARAESTPNGNALLRAAKSREVKPDAVRNPTALSGLGVIAVTSAGEDLCVGSRTLLIDQKISIATAEWRMGELEAMGRSIVLVALSGRLVGIVALQDGIRPGARSAVQHLLDAQIEPVLMSGDSRETCEAIARSLDIEHIRPEVAPGATADEVKRVAETGGSVAVFGHTGLDDAALGAANVAVALGAAGSAQAEQEVAIASDDLRDAALSLALARRTRIEARVGFGLAAIPPTLGTLVVALGVLPPAFVPLAALIGGAMGVLHGRAASRQG